MADFPLRTLSQNTDETNPGIWLNPLKSQKIPMFSDKFPMFSHTIYTLEPTQCCSGQRRVRFCYTFIVDFPSSVSGASFCMSFTVTKGAFLEAGHSQNPCEGAGVAPQHAARPVTSCPSAVAPGHIVVALGRAAPGPPIANLPWRSMCQCILKRSSFPGYRSTSEYIKSWHIVAQKEFDGKHLFSKWWFSSSPTVTNDHISFLSHKIPILIDKYYLSLVFAMLLSVNPILDGKKNMKPISRSKPPVEHVNVHRWDFLSRCHRGAAWHPT